MLFDKTKNKLILFGAGNRGIEVLKRYGNENVACFCDNYKVGETLMGKPVISIDELKLIYRNHRVIITPQHYEIIWEMESQLRELGIDYDIFEIVDTCIHVYGDSGRLTYKYDERMKNDLHFRIRFGTVPMLERMFDRYKKRFIGNKIDFWLCAWDQPEIVELVRRTLKIDTIFAYSTMNLLENKVIPFPDYKFYTSGLMPNDTRHFDESFLACKKAGERPWIYSQAFWAGNMMNDRTRYLYRCLSWDYPEKVACSSFVWNEKWIWGRDNFIPMLDYPKYKYLVDMRGFGGWTDRLKFLLAMKRPVFIQERPEKEHFFNELEPMVHYVPVREDLSDLIEKIDLLDSDDSLYKQIIQNAERFVDRYFSEEAVLKDMADKIEKYGLA